MPLTTTSLRDDVKRKFRITAATLDSDVDACVELAVDSLAPYVQELSLVEAVVDSKTDTSIGTDATAKRVLILGSDGLYYRYDDWYQEGGIVYFKGGLVDTDQYRIHTYSPYAIADIAVIPTKYRRGIVAFASAEFSSLLAGDKSAYNIYAQSNGARAVDNMLDLAQYYEELGERLLSRLGTSEAIS